MGRRVAARYVGHEAPHVGVTALAGMSFLAHVAAKDGRARASHRDAAVRALRYVASRVQPDGFITDCGSRMYSHAFATLFLARACRCDLAALVPGARDKLELAVGLLVRTQNAEGGWRYLPGATDSDLSIVACQIAALEEARESGVAVPEDTLRRALAYVKRTLLTVPAGTGAFCYQPSSGTAYASRHSFALTACGIATLHEAGVGESFAVRTGLTYLSTHRPHPATAAGSFDYYYGHYYAVKAVRSAGPAFREAWCRQVRTELLALQDRDGRWSDLVGPHYATAMATLILQESAALLESRQEFR